MGDASAPAPTSLPSRRAVVLALGVSGLGDLGSKVAVLVTTIAAAHLVDPAGFAAYAGLLAIALIAAAMWDAGISTLVSVQGAHNAPFNELVRRVVRVRVLTVPIAVATLAVGFLVFGQVTALDPGVVALVAVGAFLAGCSLPLQAWLRGRMAFGKTAGALILGRWITSAITLGFVIGDADISLASLFGAQAVGEAVTLAVLIVAVARLPARPHPGWDPRTVGFRAALPYAANTVLSIAYSRLDIILVAVLTSAAQLAAYVPASRLQDASYLLPTAVSAVAIPQLSRVLSAGDRVAGARLVRRLWGYALLIAIPAAGLLIWWMPWVVTTLLGAEYADAVPAARILVLSVIVASVGSATLALLVAAGRGWATTRAFLVAFVCSVALHVLLDPRFGAVGAAVASLTRDVANLATAAWLARDLLSTER